MNTITQTITPELAAAYLESNHMNRPLRPGVVENLVREIKAGRWRLTHQGIAFTADGRLLDGQHRLSAVVASGVAVPMMVTFGAEIDTFGVIDQSTPRSAADVLSQRRPDAVNLSAIAGAARSMMCGIGKPVNLARDEVARFADEHYRLISRFVGVLLTKPGQRYLSPSPVVAAFCNAVRVGGYDENAVLSLAERYVTATFHGDGDPVKKLYVRMSSARDNARNGRITPTRLYGFAVSMIRAGVANRQIANLIASDVDFGHVLDARAKLAAVR